MAKGKMQSRSVEKKSTLMESVKDFFQNYLAQ